MCSTFIRLGIQFILLSWCFFSFIGERAGAGAADKRASTGQPTAVHSADWYQGHCAAG